MIVSSSHVLRAIKKGYYYCDTDINTYVATVDTRASIKIRFNLTERDVIVVHDQQLL